MTEENSKKSHYIGHRQRLRNKFSAEKSNIYDYELIEMLLFYVFKRRDTKKLAKDLLEKFQNLKNLIAAESKDLEKIPGIGKSTSLLFTLMHEIYNRMAFEPLKESKIIASSSQVLHYYQTKMENLKKEQFHVMFLNNKNRLLADEIMQFGTINRAAVYPREIIEKALEYGASAIIMVHNHPSGDPQPSRQDVIITRQIRDIAQKLDIELLDHLIIGKNSYRSLRESDLI